jgi:predicted anti-sigma-YlaC factor YlaD
MRPPNHTGWLWWLALLIAAAAGVSVYFLKQDVGNIHADQTIRSILLVATVAIGLCIISATHRFWLKR